MTDRRNNEAKIRLLPSQEELNRVLSYDAETGALSWKERPRSDFVSDRQHKVWNARYAGGPALATIHKSGYRHGHLFGVLVKAHRVIWKMITGHDARIIDHENGVRSFNRWTNLVSGSDLDNLKNKKEYANNKSGVTGVYWNKAQGVWHAQIRDGGVRYHLGFYANLDDARSARAKAEADMGFHTNHGRKVIS